MDNKKLLGNRIRTLRKAKGLTQEALAEELGISVNFLSACERGINFPSVSNCERITSIFGVCLKDLFDFHEKSRKASEYDVAFDKLKTLLASEPHEFVEMLNSVVIALRPHFRK